ncbi:non-heme iron oxygenase ferredoxin subunit [Lacunimicrobium album]
MARKTDKYKVAEMGETWTSDRKSVIVDDLPALLFHFEGSYYCIEDVCTHDGQPLTDGERNEYEIVCPRHGACFDIRSGKATCFPATEPVRVFPVSVEADGVYVEA